MSYFANHYIKRILTAVHKHKQETKLFNICYTIQVKTTGLLYLQTGDTEFSITPFESTGKSSDSLKSDKAVIWHLSEKMLFPCFFILSGSAETLVR